MAPPRTPAIVFDDGRGMLAPLTDLRAAFDVRTGALTTLDRLRSALRLHILALFVPPELANLVAEAHTQPVNAVPEGLGDAPDGAPVLAINGRCPLPLEAITGLSPGQVLVEQDSGDPIAARLPLDEAVRLAMGGAVDGERVIHEGRELLARPWHVRASRDAALAHDLGRILAGQTEGPPCGGVTIIPGHAVRIHGSARVYPGVTLDLEQGPIVIDAGATLRPGATLIGPVYVGRDAVVLDQSLIKPQTAIGPVCKVAGEVGGTIFQGYANKAHEGHLGDSWVGEWANLGAGTTNSNLLNTYGEVTAVAAPHAHRERTGERYLGAIIGDHVKTAICTRLMTGVVIHTGAMLAQTPTVSGVVPPFAWTTDGGARAYRLDRFLEVARTVMGRRDVEPSPAYVDRLRALHERAAERAEA